LGAVLATEIFQFDNFELDLGRYELRRGDRVVKLEKHPLELLILLVENQGRLVTREQIGQRLWGDDVYVDTRHGINTAVHKLRNALRDDSEQPRILETVVGKGYKLIIEVVPRTSNGNRSNGKRQRFEPSRTTHPKSKAQSNTIDSLAVLPLINVTGIAESEYFADGLTELIIRRLSRLPSVRVMARTTVFRYKGKEMDVQTVGTDLNVSAVIVGQMLKQGSQISLSVELVDVEDGSQLWSCRYERDLSNFFDVQNEIAEDISEQLRLHLTGSERKYLQKQGTHDQNAYQLYLTGRFHLARRTEVSLEKSLECFQMAVHRDPAFSLAYAGLTEAYLSAEYCSLISPRIAFPEAKKNIEKAVQLDPSSPEAQTALAIVRSFHEWDTEAGETALLNAIRLNPNYSNAWHRYGVPHLSSLRRFDEAEAALRKALEIDPFSLLINAHLGLVLSYGKHFAAAEEQFLKTLEMDPNFPDTHSFLGEMYWWSGQSEKATEHIQRGISLSGGNVRMRCILAGIKAAHGSEKEARAELDGLLSLAQTRYVSPVFLSLVHLGLGDIDKTFELLEIGFQERSPVLPVLNAWPSFDSFRDDRRFKQLFRAFL
jgi:TolB-like protein/Flp pilus assembly protein TadD